MQAIICGKPSIKKCCGSCNNFSEIGVVIGYCNIKKYKEKLSWYGKKCNEFVKTNKEIKKEE